MTDLEKFIDTYKQFGIEVKPFVYEDNDDYQWIILNGCEDNSSLSHKFDGYGCFYSDLKFDKDGKFIGQGFWE